MVRVKAITPFSYSKFDEIKELIRANAQNNEKGYIYINDIFLVSNEQAKYLTETADWCKQYGPLVKIIEVIPDEKPVKKPRTKKVK